VTWDILCEREKKNPRSANSPKKRGEYRTHIGSKRAKSTSPERLSAKRGKAGESRLRTGRRLQKKKKKKKKKTKIKKKKRNNKKPRKKKKKKNNTQNGEVYLSKGRAARGNRGAVSQENDSLLFISNQKIRRA